MVPGAGHAILLEGVNDLGVPQREKPASAEEPDALVAKVTGACSQMAARAGAGDASVRRHGDAVRHQRLSPLRRGVGADACRAINARSRAPGHFDAVIDFDRALRDPARPDRLSPAFDSGDGLHPPEAGYRAVAEAVRVGLFR